VAASGSKIFAPGLLNGQVCLLSGAGSGIGRETALELARLGATVVGCGRRSEPVEETAEMIAGAGGTAEGVACDIRDEEAVEAMVEALLERHGQLDVLINNAGGQFLAPAETISAKGFRTVTELNVQGTWNMTHAAATKAFIPQRSGRPRRRREHDANALGRVVALRHPLRCRRPGPDRDRDVHDQVPARDGRDDGLDDPARPPRPPRGGRLADHLSRLARRRLLQRHHGHR
jgi:NAD(P)-dependent dehydrogenase (short-subunit alcohol dehydrogenase family)